MPLRLKGIKPAPGQPDRRYYMIDVQEAGRRERLSTGTRDRALAERREQAVLDALRDDPSVPRDDLLQLARGESRAALLAAQRARRTMTFKDACDSCLSDPKGWGRAESRDSYETNCRMLQAVLGADTLVATIGQPEVDALGRICSTTATPSRPSTASCTR